MGLGIEEERLSEDTRKEIRREEREEEARRAMEEAEKIIALDRHRARKIAEREARERSGQ